MLWHAKDIHENDSKNVNNNEDNHDNSTEQINIASGFEDIECDMVVKIL